MSTKSEEYLYLDIGNTRLKAKTLKDGKWSSVYTAETTNPDEWQAVDWMNLSGGNKIIMCSVVPKLTEYFKSHYKEEKILSINHKNIPAELLNYETPDTLGMDRLMASWGAYERFGQACIVIDSGTACTIDYIDEQGVFQGGIIMPGLNSLGRALHEFTGALPLSDKKSPESYPPKTTMDAIRAGTVSTFHTSIDYHVNRLRELNSNVLIVLTGGEAPVLKTLISKAKTTNDLVFLGMKRFLHLSSTNF